jgi:hypothetical protein
MNCWNGGRWWRPSPFDLPKLSDTLSTSTGRSFVELRAFLAAMISLLVGHHMFTEELGKFYELVLHSRQWSVFPLARRIALYQLIMPILFWSYPCSTDCDTYVYVQTKWLVILLDIWYYMQKALLRVHQQEPLFSVIYEQHHSLSVSGINMNCEIRCALTTAYGNDQAKCGVRRWEGQLPANHSQTAIAVPDAHRICTNTCDDLFGVTDISIVENGQGHACRVFFLVWRSAAINSRLPPYPTDWTSNRNDTLHARTSPGCSSTSLGRKILVAMRTMRPV